MGDAATVVVTKLTAYVPLPEELATDLSTIGLWTFYIPLLYVTLLPLISMVIAMIRECLKRLLGAAAAVASCERSEMLPSPPLPAASTMTSRAARGRRARARTTSEPE